MRLIDADALLKDINDYPYGYRGMIKDTIAIQPTVEPKHGHWIEKRDIHGFYSQCSECGLPFEYAVTFCPHCGAKMDEVEDETD